MIYGPEIARRFGVSRTPVALALRQLQEEGLVRTVSGVGHMVAPISEREYREIGQLWKILEIAAIQMACEVATDAQLHALESLAAGDVDALFRGMFSDSQGAVRWFEANTAFHVRLAEFSGNLLLAHTTRRLLEGARRYYHVGVLAPLDGPLPHPHHKEIAEALLRRDAAQAIALSNEDLTFMERVSLRSFADYLECDAGEKL